MVLLGLCAVSLIGCGPKGDSEAVADPAKPANGEYSDNDQQSVSTEEANNPTALESHTYDLPDLERLLRREKRLSRHSKFLPMSKLLRR